MEAAVKIVNDIKSGQIKPIYFLMGEEPYYIDKIADYIEDKLLAEEEKGFNQTIVYGRDVSVDDVVSASRRYPMMAERQVVIVKEAQELSRTIEQFADYAANPTPSTVLVVCYKYKTIDKRKKLYKTLDKSAVLFESKKMYDNQVGSWVTRVAQGKGYTLEPKAAAMLVEFLGNDLSRIANELGKLEIILSKGTAITPKHIEENIGISKDFNVFELRAAIGSKNELQAYRIAQYFAENPKDNPVVMVNGQLFNFFSNLLQYHGLKDKNPKQVVSALGISNFFVKDYEMAAKNYPMKKVSAIVGHLRALDVKSKGVGSYHAGTADLLKESLAKIFM